MPGIDGQLAGATGATGLHSGGFELKDLRHRTSSNQRGRPQGPFRHKGWQQWIIAAGAFRSRREALGPTRP